MTPKSLEVLSILGPFLSKISSFPDSDPAVADQYFASSNPFSYEAGLDVEVNGYCIGARNYGDIKSSANALRSILSNTTVSFF